MSEGRPHSTPESYFRFCPRCAAPLAQRTRHGRLRATCPRCEYVQWRNPVVGVAAVILEAAVISCLGPDAVRFYGPPPGAPSRPPGGRVLLVRRAASYPGTWCFPCGYVEFDEDIREALVREVAEETGLSILPGEVISVRSNFHDPDNQSVGIWFAATPTGGSLKAGDDADDLGFFTPGMVEVSLAFPTDALVMQSLCLS